MLIFRHMELRSRALVSESVSLSSTSPSIRRLNHDRRGFSDFVLVLVSVVELRRRHIRDFRLDAVVDDVVTVRSDGRVDVVEESLVVRSQLERTLYTVAWIPSLMSSIGITSLGGTSSDVFVNIRCVVDMPVKGWKLLTRLPYANGSAAQYMDTFCGGRR